MELNLSDVEGIILNKCDFIKEVAKRSMLSEYAVEEVFISASGLIAERLISEDDIEIPKLGRFELVERKSMTGKNLFGNNEKKLDACKYPIFKICSSIKIRVKNGCKYQKCSQNT